MPPTCLDSGFPNRWITHWDLDNFQIPITPRLFRFRIAEPLDYPNGGLNEFQIPIFPWPFGWISRPDLITQLRFDKCQIPIFPRPFRWISKPGLITQLQFDKCQIPIFPDCLDEFPDRVWLPNYDLTKCQTPIFPRLFGWISKPGPITQLRFNKCQISIFPRPFGWISKSGLISQLRFDKVSNPNLSPTIWINFQTWSDYPIAIWQNVKTQFFHDCLDEFPNRVPNCDLTKYQIPILPRPFGWISKPGLITQLWFDKCQIPISPRPFG